MTSTPSDHAAVPATSGDLTAGSSASTASAASPASTAAGTSTPRRRKGTHPPDPQGVGKMIALRAGGDTMKQIATKVGCTAANVQYMLAKPENQAEVLRLSALMKTQAIERSQRSLNPAFDMADACIAERDTKGFDAATRGIYSLEKIRSSASGEAQRTEQMVRVEDTRPAIEELKLLIAVIQQGGS